MEKIQILIIEDEALIARHIQKTLERKGYQVIAICNNADDVFSTMLHAPVNLVLSDIQIKGEIDGIELAEVIQKSFNVPVIFLTSYCDDKTLKRATNIHFESFIVKPYLEEHLLREIKLALLKQSSHSNQKKLVELGNDYVYSIQERKLFFKKTIIELTKKEQYFLYILVKNLNNVVSSEQINLALWYEKVVDDESRRQLLFRLRKKVPLLDIETVKGKGYILKVFMGD